MDGPTGTSSYLVNVPNGGVVYLRGNLFHKGPRADNSTAIAFGEEGLPWSVNTLEMVHNTLVMTWSGGTYVSAVSAIQSVRFTANLFAGTNNPNLLSGGVAAGKVVQASNVTSTAANFSGADNTVAPNFWPNAGLVAQMTLAGIPDPGYASEHRGRTGNAPSRQPALRRRAPGPP